jgi:hypothetical protein
MAWWAAFGSGRPSCGVAQVYGARFYWAHQRQLTRTLLLTKA